jgi:hypothetical protein
MHIFIAMCYGDLAILPTARLGNLQLCCHQSLLRVEQIVKERRLKRSFTALRQPIYRFDDTINNALLSILGKIIDDDFDFNF